MLTASHTHWGPAVRFQMSYSVGAPNVWHMGVLEDKILANVDAALANLKAASLEYGSIDFKGIGSIRRFPVDGEIEWRPYAEGSFDGHTPILRIKYGENGHQLLIVGHACHPTSSGSVEKWTPDYPGATRDHLARNLPGARAMFVQGCGGDAKVTHKDPETGKLVFSADPNRANAAGEKLAEAVMVHLVEHLEFRTNELSRKAVTKHSPHNMPISSPGRSRPTSTPRSNKSSPTR